MKKSLIVLLIAVLALSSVFAAITGSTTASYKVDFTDMSASYTVPGTGNLDADVTLDLQSQPKLGEGNAYVDFEAEAKLDVIYSEDSLHAAGALSGVGVADPAIKIKKADIVAGNWKIDLLKATTAFDYAQSAIDSVTAHEDTLEEAKVYYTFKNTVGLDAKGAKIVDNSKYLVAIDLDSLQKAIDGIYTDVKPAATKPVTKENVAESGDSVKQAKYQKAFCEGGKVNINSVTTMDAAAYKLLTALDGVNYYVLADLSTTTKKLGNGLTVSYDGFSFGLSFERENETAASEKSQLIVGFETKEFALDEFKFQAAIALSSSKAAKLVSAEVPAVPSESDAIPAVYELGAATTQFAVSAKAGYSDIFTAAVDMKVATNSITGFDVSAKVAYDPLTVDFYYASTANVYDNVTGDALEAGKFVATEITVAEGDKYVGNKTAADVATTKYYEGSLYELANSDATEYTQVEIDDEEDVYLVNIKDANTKTNLMSVKGALDFASFDVPVKLTVTAKDILGANTLDVEASTTAVDGLEIAMYLKDAFAARRLGGKLAFTGFEGLTLSAEANYQLAASNVATYYALLTSEDDTDKDNKVAPIYYALPKSTTDVDAGTFWADFNAAYAAEKFTAKAEAEFRAYDKLRAVPQFGFTASIESDKLVNGATLKLAYKYVPSALRNLDEAGNAITASCKVVF